MTAGEDGAAHEPWYAGKQISVAFFRVNRRPLPQPGLWGTPPEDVLDHVARALLFGAQIQLRGTRTWRLGNRDIDMHGRTISGEVGWASALGGAIAQFDEESASWQDTDAAPTGIHAPFCFDASSRQLAVVMHPSFRAGSIADVFTGLLQRGERESGDASTDWAVEPILDREEFAIWLDSLDSLVDLRITARVPNPGGKASFEETWERMKARKAALLQIYMKSADPATGLLGVTEDEQVRQLLAMSEESFATTKANGIRDGRAVRFDQRQTVATSRTRGLPLDRAGIVGALAAMIQSRHKE